MVSIPLFDAAYSLAFRGLFLVDYDKFPSYREASVEACIASDDIGSPLNGSSVLTPQHSVDPDGVYTVKLSDTDVVDVPAAVATQQDFDSGSSRVIPPKIEDAAEASRKLQPPSPWELPKLPHLDEFERTTSPNMIPDLWKMRFFPTQENLEIVDDIDSDTLEIEPIQLPFLQELESVPDQDTELDVTGLRMFGTEPLQSPETPQPQEIQEVSEASEPLLQQEENSDLYNPDESKIASNEDFDKPSKFLTVRGIRPSVSMKQLCEKFASFHPVNIRRYVPNSAQVEFVDIEAATKALNGMHGTLVGGRFINCSFKSDLPEEKRTGPWMVASEPPVNDYKEDPLSTHGTKQHQDALSPLTTTITETITEVPTESTKQAVIETLKDVTTEAAKEAAIEAPTEITVQRSSLSPDSDLPDPSTPMGTISRKEGKKSKRVGRVRRGLKKGPVESTIDKPSDPTKDQQVTTVEAERHDGLLYRGDADYRPPQNSSTSQATSDDFETDDITLYDELIASDEPCISNRLGSKPPWAKFMTGYLTIRKPRRSDHILPEISQLSTTPVPVTRAYWLPHSTQIQVLCGLQALAERVCFRYLQRKHPEILKETATQWGIDSPHVLELNQYIQILRTLVLPDSDAVWKGFGSRTILDLRQSMVLLRHAAVHRRIQDICTLRGWTSDGFKLAKLLDDPEAAEQFLAMALYLRTQYHKIRSEKMKAEEKLLTTLKELTAKRAELDRAEREAMDAFEEDHKQVHKVLDANVPLDPEPGINPEETSTIKPASGIFGRIKSWLGA
ncbi:hypothetical protein E4T48_02843 [Aureobasidium sp. EXF-10727]|nr:hypothetical protein E4T48_02843 [Aureobasidium sp. EXF-10727]